MLQSFPKSFERLASQNRLRTVLVVPFVVQIVGTVGLVGYLSFKSGQQAIGQLAEQLMNQASDRVEKHLDDYLETPRQINSINANAIEMGLLDLNDPRSAGYYFWKQAQIFPEISYIGYGIEKGIGGGAGRWLDGKNVTIDEFSARRVPPYRNYATDKQGNRTKVIETGDYNPLIDDWYVTTVKAGKPVWKVAIAQNYDNYIAASANYPIYDKNRQLVGVIGVDLMLSSISQFLNDLKVSQSGQMFIIDREGQLIANSGSSAPYKTINETIRRIKVTESLNSLVRTTAEYLFQNFGDFQQIKQSQQLNFSVNGDRHFVRVTPWQDSYGLDWLVVIVVPEADFMGEINTNLRTTIILCFGALFVSIAIGFLTARWIVNPIVRLNQAAREIARGNLDQEISIQRSDEVGELARAFNSMSDQLQALFASLANSQEQLAEYNRNLEEQVQKRTQELIQAEKLAALGQLVAGIAHEINTPIGAISASISNITHAIQESTQQLPQLLQKLSPEYLAEFFIILNLAQQPKEPLSSREERQLKRTLKEFFRVNGIENTEVLADIFSQMRVIPEELTSVMSLLRSPDNIAIVQAARHLSIVQNNSQNIKLAVNRASRIVFALRSYSRQTPTGERTLASIPDTLEIVLTLYGDRIKRGVEIAKSYASVPFIFCYPDELTQVWTNLIGNALDAMNYQGSLSINVFERDNYLVVEIIDTGCGIFPENRAKIFEPFFTTKPMGEGSGLGLSIVRQIIDKHQGKVEVLSQPGHTKFSVWLPIQ
jgi:C4-dicarboxylate-specific signal transduction histidine kinase